MAARDYGQYDGVTRGLELVGERWAFPARQPQSGCFPDSCLPDARAGAKSARGETFSGAAGLDQDTRIIRLRSGNRSMTVATQLILRVRALAHRSPSSRGAR